MSWRRCNPYGPYRVLKNICDNNLRTDHISLQFDHSIDGEPFYRIIDEENICDLTYKTFSHNTWIKNSTESRIVGYPVQNIFRYANQRFVPQNRQSLQATSTDNLIVLGELVGNHPPSLNGLQMLLKPYTDSLVLFWKLV